MKLKNTKSGFTLLEIIIVIIIVGVLASLALPRLFDTIEYSRSMEALAGLGTLKRSADRCTMQIEGNAGPAADYANCDSFAELDAEDPGGAMGAIFSYTVDGMNGNVWEATATRVGGPGAGTITLGFDTGAGTTARSGTLQFSGMK